MGAVDRRFIYGGSRPADAASCISTPCKPLRFPRRRRLNGPENESDR
jgi:hypothetical protein